MQVKLKDGDKVDLVSDVDEEAFETFTSFRSTQFFATEFERTDGLLTEEKVEEEEELSWFETENSLNMPNWVLLLICLLVVLFIILGVYICIQMRRNKSERSLQERAILRELTLAKEEGVEIPEDLEKRL